MSDTPRTDAVADDMEHLGPGGRAMHYGKLWSLCRQLERENADLRKDAERYRFIKKHKNYQGSLNGYSTFEQAIDAAMEGK